MSFRSVGMDGIDDEACLHAHGRTVAAVATLDFPGDKTVSDVALVGTAILLGERHAQKATAPSAPTAGATLELKRAPDAAKQGQQR